MLRIPVLIIMGLFFHSAWAQANRPMTVQWAIHQAPPFHISAGPAAGMGICDALVDSIEAALPQFHYERKIMPAVRAARLMEDGENLCFPCSILKADRSTVKYSQATHSYASHGIIAKQTTIAAMQEKYGDPIQLEQLLRTGSYTFANPLARRFGQIQPIIDQYLLHSDNYVEVAGETSSENVLAMLASNRVDYTIDYPMMLNYWQAQFPEQLGFAVIAENSSQRTYGAVACTNNDWGEQVIEGIDANLATIRANPKFQAVLERWLSR